MDVTGSAHGRAGLSVPGRQGELRRGSGSEAAVTPAITDASCWTTNARSAIAPIVPLRAETSD